MCVCVCECTCDCVHGTLASYPGLPRTRKNTFCSVFFLRVRGRPGYEAR